MTGVVNATEAPPPEVIELEAKARRIETPCGDGTMVWRVWGEGEPLVLAHGAQGAWSHWLRNIEALAEHRMVIAADLPGHGDSAMPATPDHEGISRALADGLREILGESGLRVDLLGFSFGGVAFSHLAALYPGVARRVILVGCGGLDTPHGHVDLRRVKGLQGEERREGLKRNLLGLMLHDADSVDDFAIWQVVANARKARLDVSGLVMPDRLVRVLPDVDVPVDAIWGEFDRPHPDPHVQEDVLRRVKPEVDFRVIAGAGHWAMFERPEEFNRTVLDMLGAPGS